MSILSDSIEAFIKSMIGEDDQLLELQRNELAQYFKCAPSQINYVLATRFTLEHGYCVESKRGGGGYVKVFRVRHDPGSLPKMMLGLIEEGLSFRKVAALLGNLREHGFLTLREERLLATIMSDKAMHLPLQIQDQIRANMMRAVLEALCLNGENADEQE